MESGKTHLKNIGLLKLIIKLKGFLMFKSAMKTLTLASFFLSLNCIAESGDIKLVCETTGTEKNYDEDKKVYERTFNIVFNDSSGKFCIERKCEDRYIYFRGKENTTFKKNYYTNGKEAILQSTKKVIEWSPVQIKLVNLMGYSSPLTEHKYHLDREAGTFRYYTYNQIADMVSSTDIIGPCTKVTKFSDEKAPKF